MRKSPKESVSSNRLRTVLWLAFIVTLYIAYSVLREQAMGVKDLLARINASSSSSNDVIGGGGQHQKPMPPLIPHGTRPRPPNAPQKPPGRPFVVVRNGQLELDDGTPFRFASLNAPELLDNHEFEVEDTMRTLAGFGRRVTRTYTLKIKGTSPHFGDVGHINGWDHTRGDWMYDENKFQKVSCYRFKSGLPIDLSNNEVRCTFN